MNTPQRQPTNVRDLAHAAVLLMLVPVIFYGGYQLVSRSAEAKRGETSDLGRDASKTVDHAKDYIRNRNAPPPGDVWISEVEQLSQQLYSIDPSGVDSQVAKRRLGEQLASIRGFCTDHIHELPPAFNPSTALGEILVGIEGQLRVLAAGSSTPLKPQDWETAFAVAESQRRSDQAIRINSLYRDLTTESRKLHDSQLATLTRQSRELADELQRIVGMVSQIERDAREETAKQERYTAFLSDKAQIDRLLTPFTTAGYDQLRNGWNDWKKTTEAKPLSYRDLERLGALATDIDGIRTFARIGGMPTHMTKFARPLGAFPAYYDTTLSNPTQMETVKLAQQLIKKHSLYLIETGMLQP